MQETPATSLTFEQALAELERIVQELEEGALGLEEALARYEQGVGLLKQCYQQLQQAEQRIRELLGIDEVGQPVTRPFEHAPTLRTLHPEPDHRRRAEDGE
jgi:exodeoxyribonuclease VII small subunit